MVKIFIFLLAISTSVQVNGQIKSRTKPSNCNGKDNNAECTAQQPQLNKPTRKEVQQPPPPKKPRVVPVSDGDELPDRMGDRF